MTQEQYDRWVDFALRMPLVAIGGKRWQNEVRSHVEELLSRFDCENFGCHYSQIRNWDHDEDIPGDDGTCYFAMTHPTRLVCDMVSEYCFDEGLEREHEYRNGHIEIVESKVCLAVRCCLRAGLDIAVAPSAGVCGFSAGDIRKMYPDGVPAWVKEFFQPGDTVALHATNTEGIYVPEVTGFDSRSFDELPDEQPVWL